MPDIPGFLKLLLSAKLVCIYHLYACMSARESTKNHSHEMNPLSLHGIYQLLWKSIALVLKHVMVNLLIIKNSVAINMLTIKVG